LGLGGDTLAQFNGALEHAARSVSARYTKENTMHLSKGLGAVVRAKPPQELIAWDKTVHKDESV
tara:strand:+ start:318 stop:509 length:192 start_codon:yes stop_codon:yes gene_type:complete